MLPCFCGESFCPAENRPALAEAGAKFWNAAGRGKYNPPHGDEIFGRGLRRADPTRHGRTSPQEANKFLERPEE